MPDITEKIRLEVQTTLKYKDTFLVVDGDKLIKRYLGRGLDETVDLHAMLMLSMCIGDPVERLCAVRLFLELGGAKPKDNVAMETFFFLADHGEGKDGGYGYSEEDESIVKLLLHYGYNVTTPKIYEYFSTFLFYLQKEEILPLLVSAGFDVKKLFNEYSKECSVPCLEDTMESDELLELFLHNGMDINVQDSLGRTLFLVAYDTEMSNPYSDFDGTYLFPIWEILERKQWNPLLEDKKGRSALSVVHSFLKKNENSSIVDSSIINKFKNIKSSLEHKIFQLVTDSASARVRRKANDPTRNDIVLTNTDIGLTTSDIPQYISKYFKRGGTRRPSSVPRRPSSGGKTKRLYPST